MSFNGKFQYSVCTCEMLRLQWKFVMQQQRNSCARISSRIFHLNWSHKCGHIQAQTNTHRVIAAAAHTHDILFFCSVKLPMAGCNKHFPEHFRIYRFFYLFFVYVCVCSVHFVVLYWNVLNSNRPGTHNDWKIKWIGGSFIFLYIHFGITKHKKNCIWTSIVIGGSASGYIHLCMLNKWEVPTAYIFYMFWCLCFFFSSLPIFIFFNIVVEIFMQLPSINFTQEFASL